MFGFSWLLERLKLKVPTEHPQRLTELKASLDSLSWDATSRNSSSSKAFDAIEEIALAEHKYYYHRRTKSRWISAITRAFGWVCGTVGVLLPLFGSAYPEFKNGAAWGYFFLAASGTFFGANALFSATVGHASYVKAQLQIEHLIVRTRLEWTAMVAEVGDAQLSNEAISSRFKIMNAYMAALSKIVNDETSQWEKNLVAEFERIRSAKTKK